MMFPLEPSSAACSPRGTKTSTSTTGYPGSCYSVQAQITRYFGGPVTYNGSWSTTRSYVSSSNGYNAGHAVRGGQTNGAIGPWKRF
jgi:hypothetical protein